MTSGDQNGQPPKKPTGGRPSRDWDALFQEWLKSGLTRTEFLQLKGMDPAKNGTVRAKTSHWEDTIAQARDSLNDQYMATLAQRGQRPKQVAAVVENMLERERDDGTKEPHVAGTPLASSWQLIHKWRSNQANQDWKMADQARVHVALVFKHALHKVQVKDDAGKVLSEDWQTTLKPHEIRQLIMCVGEVQRVQRLALGLSTENIGIDALIDQQVSEPAKPGDAAQPRNLFVVEMTKGGKFMRARPRQVS